MTYNLSKPHYDFSIFNIDSINKECLDSREEYLKRELDELRAKYEVIEKSMRWWSDCTAHWREKWVKLKSDKVKLTEEISQQKETIKSRENDNEQLSQIIKNIRNSNICDCNDKTDLVFLENKIQTLQEEVNRLSNLLGEAQNQLNIINTRCMNEPQCDLCSDSDKLRSPPQASPKNLIEFEDDDNEDLVQVFEFSGDGVDDAINNQSTDANNLFRVSRSSTLDGLNFSKFDADVRMDENTGYNNVDNNNTIIPHTTDNNTHDNQNGALRSQLNELSLEIEQHFQV